MSTGATPTSLLVDLAPSTAAAGQATMYFAGLGNDGEVRVDLHGHAGRHHQLLVEQDGVALEQPMSRIVIAGGDAVWLAHRRLSDGAAVEDDLRAVGRDVEA